MLDVHPPHGPLHGIKDFLLHLFTITVGLLIAVAIEGCVERSHKAQARREAEQYLRLEMQDNATALTAWRVTLQDETKTLTRAIDFIEATKAGKPYDVSGMQLGFSIRSLHDASWRTANATGALSLMDYRQVQRYAGVYQVQEEMTRLGQLTFDDFLKVQSYAVYAFDPTRVSSAEAAEAEPIVRSALAHLVATDQIGAGLEKDYQAVLSGQTK